MGLHDIDPYPWFLNKNLDLVINERIVHTRTTATEWADHWRPFLAHLHDLWLARFPKRFIIAIAGPPGAGKSLLAEHLHWMIDRGFLHRDAHSIALPMDGFHYSNRYLESHTRKLADGTEIKLSSVKGEPDTIDLARFRRYAHALIARPEYLSWPAYSRETHDVVPEKFLIHQSINLVIIEGNYLLVNRGHFAGLPDLYDLRVYVDAPAPKIVANLVERHILGGKSIEQAKDWVKRIDLPNARIAEASKPIADVIIERDTDNDIASLTWIRNGPAPESAPQKIEDSKSAPAAPPPVNPPLVDEIPPDAPSPMLEDDPIAPPDPA